jgi:hypothetical protein
LEDFKGTNNSGDPEVHEKTDETWSEINGLRKCELSEHFVCWIPLDRELLDKYDVLALFG